MKVCTLLQKSKWSKNDLSCANTLLRDADDAYFNTGSPIMTDQEYDALRARMPKCDRVGYVPRSNKVKLPHWMGSLNKLKESEPIVDWVRKHRSGSDGVVVSDKLDGVSALLTYTDGCLSSAHTRGDGMYGQDITKHMMKRYACTKEPITVTVRGELIIPRAIHARSRNIVSGFVNSDDTTNHPNVNDIRFVAYEVVEPVGMNPQEQFKWLHKNYFDTAYHRHFAWNDLSMESLTRWLEERKELSVYDIDGIVVAHNTYHPPVGSKNAEHAFAFKSALFFESKPTTVVRVLWNMSKDGYLKPTVECRPVTFNDGAVTVTKCTGFNAKYIVDNVIGPGSKITVVLSGDVIPHIAEVVSPSTSGTPGLMCDFDTDMYEWSPSGVDIRIIANKHDSCEDMQRVRFVHMLTKLKIDGLKVGTITRLFNEYNIRTLKQLFELNINTVKGMTGFGESSASKLVTAIQHKRTHMNWLELMVASTLFGRGFGERKLKPIVDKYPPMECSPSVSELMKLRGISSGSAIEYLKGLKQFRQFVQSNNIVINSDYQTEESSQIEQTEDAMLSNHVVVYTQFRDDELTNRIERRCGKVVNQVSGNTTHLLVASNEYKKDNVKVKKAIELGVEIMSRSTYVQKYLT